MSPGKKQQRAESRGLKAEGREEKDTRLRQGYQVTNPFLGARGSLSELDLLRERCEPL